MAFGNAINSFAFTPGGLRGVTFDGQYIWAVDTTGADIYQLDFYGNLIRRFNVGGINEPFDLAFDGVNLWLTRWADLRIQVWSRSGHLIRTFLTNAGETGIEIVDGYVYLGNRNSLRIEQWDKSFGGIIRTFASPERDPYGIAFDGKDFYITMRMLNQIAKVSISGAVMQIVAAPGGAVCDLAWTGKELLLTDFALNRIWLVSVN